MDERDQQGGQHSIHISPQCKTLDMFLQLAACILMPDIMMELSTVVL